MKRLLLFAALIAWSGMASAVVYKWVDAQGKLQYGDRPPDGVHAEVVELLGTHPATPRTAAARTTEASQAKIAANNSAPNAKDDADKRAVDEDVAQARVKQCTEAQDRYKRLIEGRKIYNVGPNGDREFLTSEQIDTERVNAKRDIETVCNAAS
jgi:Domain of unknown function (DUF4124)